MNEYISACRLPHADGIDFTQCNKHNGMSSPLNPFMSDCVNVRLECIFSGTETLELARPSYGHSSPN